MGTNWSSGNVIEGQQFILDEEAILNFGVDVRQVSKTFAPGTYTCNAAAFGQGDPAQGVQKSCSLVRYTSGASRYLGIRVLANNGDALLTAAEVELRGTLGGADLTTSSTPVTSTSNLNNQYPPSRLVDGNTTDSNPFAATFPTDGSAFMIWFDLVNPTLVRELAWMNQWSVGQYATRSPKDFDIVIADSVAEQANPRLVKSFRGIDSGWGNTAVFRTFNLTAVDPALNDFENESVGSNATGWVDKVGTWRVGTNRVSAGSKAFASTTKADGDMTVLSSGVTARADAVVEIAFMAATSTSNTVKPNIGIGLRADSAALNNGYLALISGLDSTRINILLFKRVGGTFTQLAVIPANFTSVPGDIIKVKFQTAGNILSHWIAKNGEAYSSAPNGQLTDSSITAAGYPWLYYAANGSPGSDQAADNFSYAEYTAPPVNNQLVNGSAKLYASPANWQVNASSLKSINPGAYLRGIFTGTACELQFDMTNIANPVPQFWYRIDNFGAYLKAAVAASVPLVIPADTADYANKGGHLLEIIFKSATETQPRWSTQSAAMALTGVVLDAGATLSAWDYGLEDIWVYGDSIDEAVRTINMTASNDTDRNDAAQGWSLGLRALLGVEIGVIGFGATGFNQSGSGGVPALPTSYDKLWNGVNRSFSRAPKAVVIVLGVNDSTDITASATNVINGLLSKTPATTKIIVVRPFKDATHATRLQNAIAASTAPARCVYVDTNGWFRTANSSDGLHPYGNENLMRIAALLANAIRSAIGTGGGSAPNPNAALQQLAYRVGDTWVTP